MARHPQYTARYVRGSDSDASEAGAVPKHATTDDGRVIDCYSWSIYTPCDGSIQVTLTGLVRRDSLPSVRRAVATPTLAQDERTGDDWIERG